MYKNLMYTKQNEAGEQEVEIVYERSFWRWLLRKPEQKEIYVGSGTVWHKKGSGERAGTKKEYEICNAIEMLRQRSTYGIYQPLKRN